MKLEQISYILEIAKQGSIGKAAKKLYMSQPNLSMSIRMLEEELGFKLDWQRLENRSASRIKYYIKGLNFDDHSNYDELIDKTITVATKMRDVFKKYI